jgi:hypothetical protein
VGQTVSARVSFTGTPADGPWTYTMDWGDRTVVRGTVLTNSPFVLTHVYTSTGSIPSRVTVRDFYGNRGETFLWWDVRAAR